MRNWRQIKAIEAKNKQRILAGCPGCADESGIYFITREEDGIKHGYVGQSVHVLTRLAEHLKGYPAAIDKSIYKRGLYHEGKPNGYKIDWVRCSLDRLDAEEQRYIKLYANNGYQLKNATTGSQSKGKKSMDNARSPKGYYDGLKQGRKNALREVASLFEKHLGCVTKKEPPTKLQVKALDKFKALLEEVIEDERRKE